MQVVSLTSMSRACRAQSRTVERELVRPLDGERLGREPGAARTKRRVRLTELEHLAREEDMPVSSTQQGQPGCAEGGEPGQTSPRRRRRRRRERDAPVLVEVVRVAVRVVDAVDEVLVWVQASVQEVSAPELREEGDGGGRGGGEEGRR